MKNRRAFNQISSLRNNEGRTVGWSTDLENVIIEYFSTLCKASVTEWSVVVECVDNKVTA